MMMYNVGLGVATFGATVAMHHAMGLPIPGIYGAIGITLGGITIMLIGARCG